MVSYSAGSINCLVDKLTKLKNHSFVIQELERDLAILVGGFFHEVAAGRRETNLQVEAWMKIVRELIFDIEDWIDQMPAMTGTGGQQPEIEEEVKEFKARIEHTRELCERYDLAIQVPTNLHVRGPAAAGVPGQLAVDSRILAGEKTGLVGMQVPTDELVKQLTCQHEKMLMVVSIVGMEGLGKTTLAKEIYAKIEGAFECRAFVTLGRRPLSMRATLMEILRQVNPSKKKKEKPKTNPNPNPSGGRRRRAKDLQKVITELWEYLCTKRYFILLDGLWSTQAWKIINCALPNENRGSRVLTTTCISDVAKCCSVRPTNVYQMEELSKNMSLLLYRKATQEEDLWPADYDEITENMLKVCCGMPLAITVTSGLLAMKSEQLTELNMPGKCVLSSFEHCSTSEGMMKILHMSYAALSLPLKSCFLYLSVFREDYTIKKDRLIRLWVSEGFIPIEDKEKRGEETTRGEETRGVETSRDEETTRDVNSMWEAGERYFNELIIRRLIQPVFDYDDDQAVGCTVHGVILDFIKSLSNKGNFVTVSGAHQSTDTVRRFSLDCYKDPDEDEDGILASITVHLSRVRSVIVLGDIEGMAGRSALTVSGEIRGMSVLPSFKLIRVLDLEDTDHLRSRHLQGIRGLALLRHLGVAGTAIDELPEEIGELELLETLDLRQTIKLTILPASIAKQKRLLHLLIDDTVKVPREILEMQGLEEVSTIGVDSSRQSIDSMEELAKKSEQLRVLGIRLDGSRLSDHKSARIFLGHAGALFVKVASSTKLRSLSLDCLHDDLLGLLLEYPPPEQLGRFRLRISTPIPRAAAHNMKSLVSVTHMDINIIQLDDGGVCVLGGLPHLVLLKLVSLGVTSSQPKKNPAEGRCKVGVDHGFKCLKVFSFIGRSGGTELEFAPGAMKELRRLWLGFSAQETLSLYGNFSFGIQHLSSQLLTQVHATINCKSATEWEVNNAKDSIRDQVHNLPIVPTTEFSTINQHIMLPDKKVNTKTSPKNWVNGCIPNFKRSS